MKIAIIKQGGLCAGGIEKYLQQIAAELVKVGDEVEYFFTDSVPCGNSGWIHPGTDLQRMQFMLDSGVRLTEVKCSRIDEIEMGGKWNDSDLFQLFDPKNFDVVIGGHKGEPNWPFSVIEGPRIVETVHGTDFTSGASNYANAYVLISEYQRQRWYNAGGDPNRTHVIAPMVAVDMSKNDLGRNVWNIPNGKFVFGMHQSARHGLFSSVPLDAYSLIQDDSNFFVLLGGTEEYDRHAHNIGLKNFMRLPVCSNSADINSVLSCFDVYAHGRFDGEVCSSAIIEAMANNLPIVTHPSSCNNGHLNQVEGCGFVAQSVSEYAAYLKVLQENSDLHKLASKKTQEKYETSFKFETCLESLLKTIRFT